VSPPSRTPHKGAGGAVGTGPASTVSTDKWNGTPEGVNLGRAYHGLISTHQYALPGIRRGFADLARRKLT